MSYGIVCLYRLSDFLKVANRHGITWIFLNSLWVKRTHLENLQCNKGGYFRWTDVHELGFMGAFGMGYHMLVEGKTLEGKVGDNRELWKRSTLLSAHVETQILKRKGMRQLSLVPGMLTGTEVVTDGAIPWDVFMRDKIPENVPVFDMTE